ncbi:6-phosphogluconate dehydrogenase [Xylogone sp. PMI_703]|nr:6-phosphogluconate dehydrogenase [Xylogone sp. PMI_703]
MSNEIKFKNVGVIGAGSMGSMLSLLLVENGFKVFFFDPNEENSRKLQKNATNIGVQDKITPQSSYEEICSNLKEPGQPKVFLFSLPHGTVGDKTVEGLRPYLNKGDIIIDCANEHFSNTERRQNELEPEGIHYIGCGVSGGYQSARSGPSFSPGGNLETIDRLMPFFSQLAAKDKKGRPCVNPVGPGSSGHYTKMVHNGIEQGMMSIISEAWFILVRGLGLSYDEASDIFKSWNDSAPLKDCFLIAIGINVMRAKDESGKKVLGYVRDKVVQDVDESEGTGTWTCLEAVTSHTPAATILSAHLFRCASADATARIASKHASKSIVQPQQMKVDSKEDFINALQMTVYFSLLISFIQGLTILRRKDKAMDWKLDYRKILQLWPAGSIIEADYITDLLDQVYSRQDHDADNLLSNAEIASELSQHYSCVKDVVLKAIEADMFVPAISQSLEYYKYSNADELPTQFMEAELDYFGEHMFDRKDESPGLPKTGSHHFEWKPAKGASDQQ